MERNLSDGDRYELLPPTKNDAIGHVSDRQKRGISENLKVQQPQVPVEDVSSPDEAEHGGYGQEGAQGEGLFPLF